MLFGRKNKNPIIIADKGVVEWKYATCGYYRVFIFTSEKERKALYERFLYSQKFAQIDPWKARAEGEAAHEFTPLKIAG